MPSKIETINPYNGNRIKNYQEFTKSKLEACLELSENTFETWKQTDIKERTTLLKTLSKNLLKNKQKFAELMTEEMGKPISQVWQK